MASKAVQRGPGRSCSLGSFDFISYGIIQSQLISLSSAPYLVFLAYIFGLLSEFEGKQNQKLLALSKTAGEVAMRDERRRIARELHDGFCSRSPPPSPP